METIIVFGKINGNWQGSKDVFHSLIRVERHQNVTTSFEMIDYSLVNLRPDREWCGRFQLDNLSSCSEKYLLGGNVDYLMFLYVEWYAWSGISSVSGQISKAVYEGNFLV
ncbi:hypothetical protein Tco_1167104 [Tanacetum coccineum]